MLDGNFEHIFYEICDVKFVASKRIQILIRVNCQLWDWGFVSCVTFKFTF